MSAKEMFYAIGYEIDATRESENHLFYVKGYTIIDFDLLREDFVDEIKKNKEGNITSVSNEAYLLNYLKKVNREVPYYKMNRGMFECNLDDMDPEITLNGEPAKPDYDVDVVVAVPV